MKSIVNLGEIELQQLITDLAQELSQRANSEERHLRLLTRITERSARIGVVGLGYVGLHRVGTCRLFGDRHRY